MKILVHVLKKPPEVDTKHSECPHSPSGWGARSCGC